MSLRDARGIHSSSNARIGNQVGLGVLKRSYREFVRHSWKIVQELLQRVTAFEVVNHRTLPQKVGSFFT